MTYSNLIQANGGGVLGVSVPRRFAVIGDSISANGGIYPSGLRTQASQGYINWLTAISGQRVNIEPIQNFSLSGQTTSQFISNGYFAAALAYQPHIVIIEGGTNDIPGGVPAVQTIANLQTMYQAFAAIGCIVVAIPIQPRTAGNTLSTSFTQNNAQVNRWIRRYAETNGRIVVADMRATGWVDSTGYPGTGMTSDGLHPNPKGALIWGQQLWALIAPFMQANDIGPLWVDPADTYDSGFNPTGNMMANGNFGTASGGTVASNPAGVLAGVTGGSWSLSFSGAGSAYTGTAVSSVVARSDGFPGKLAQIVCTSLSGTSGGAADKFQWFQQINLPAGLNVGDTVELSVMANVVATAGFNGFDADLVISDGSGDGNQSIYATCMGPYTNSSGWGQGTYSVVLKTPRILVQPSNGAVQRTIAGFFSAYADTSAGTGPATFSVQFSNVCLRKVNL